MWCDGVVNDDSPEGAGPSTKNSKKEENKEDSKEKDFDCVLKQLQKSTKINILFHYYAYGLECVSMACMKV